VGDAVNPLDDAPLDDAWRAMSGRTAANARGMSTVGASSDEPCLATLGRTPQAEGREAQSVGEVRGYGAVECGSFEQDALSNQENTPQYSPPGRAVHQGSGYSHL
jgi:hypothetical protein